MPLTAPLDLALVRAFAAVAELGSFSRAAERLLRNQSTLSLGVQRLEARLGHRLLDRSPRHVRLTPRGEAFLVAARRLLAAHDAALASAAEAPLTGTVRLGAPEDFATAHLPDVLARFARAHPGVALEVTLELTVPLLARFRAGGLDLALVKREPGRAAADGATVWREPLVWVAGPDGPPAGGPLPLVVSPDPCVYRKRAGAALDRAGRPWRVAYTCGSLAGALAAVRAGLGVAVLPRGVVPAGLTVLDGGALPRLADAEVALLAAPALGAPAARLRDQVARALEREGAAAPPA